MIHCDLDWKTDVDNFKIPVDNLREIRIWSGWDDEKEWFEEMGKYLIGYYMTIHPLKKWSWLKKRLFVYSYVGYLRDWAEDLENFLNDSLRIVNGKSINQFKRIKL